MVLVMVKLDRGENRFFKVTQSVDYSAVRRECYEIVYGVPTHPEERATDETVEDYTEICELPD